MFMFIRAYNNMKKAEPEEDPATKTCSQCAMDIPVAAKVCGHCGNTAV
jgi:large conductance mechanosensitive channel